MKLNPWICAAMIVGTMVAIATGEARAQSSAADPVTEEVYRGELVSYPGPWAFQLGKSGIILVTDEKSLPTLRRIRRAGIFYHALKPVNAEEGEEIRQAVDCAFKNVVNILSIH